MTARNVQQGHVFGLAEAAKTSHPKYKRDAEGRGAKPLPLKVYSKLLSTEIFTNTKEGTYVCAQCMKHGPCVWGKRCVCVGAGGRGCIVRHLIVTGCHHNVQVTVG